MNRFRLRTLLLAFVPIGLICFFIHDYVHHRPLHWEDYDFNKLQAELGHGHAVIVFVSGPTTCGSGRFVPSCCRDDRVCQFAIAHNTQAMHASCTATLPGISTSNAYDSVLVYHPRHPREPRIINWRDTGSAENGLLVALEDDIQPAALGLVPKVRGPNMRSR